MIRNFEELLEAAAAVGPKAIAVAAANDAQTLAACLEAKKRGVADSVLVADQEWVRLILEKAGESTASFQVIHEPDPVKAAEEAVRLVRTGDGEVLVKGNVSTIRPLMWLPSHGLSWCSQCRWSKRWWVKRRYSPGPSGKRPCSTQRCAKYSSSVQANTPAA